MLPPLDEENIVYTYFQKYKNEQRVAKTATTLYFKAIIQNLPDSSCLKLWYMLHLMKSHMLKLQRGKKNKLTTYITYEELKGKEPLSADQVSVSWAWNQSYNRKIYSCCAGQSF